MSIGETLAQARRWSGLSVTEVSQRTRIRETLVKDIERDDYSACGGDFYARGHIRAIARVVGADPEPLIEEYDATHRAPNAQLEDTVPQPVTPGQARGWPEPPTRPADGLSANVRPVGTSGWSRREPPARPPDNDPGDVRLTGSRGWPQQEPPTRPVDDASQQVTLIGAGSWQQEPPTAPAAEPPGPARVSGQQQAPPVRRDSHVPYQYGPGGQRGRAQRNWPVLFGLVLLVVLGFLGYRFVSGSSKPPAGPYWYGTSGSRLTGGGCCCRPETLAGRAGPGGSAAGAAGGSCCQLPAPMNVTC